jgi:hypothetical protein
MFIGVESSLLLAAAMILAAEWGHCLGSLSWSISELFFLFPLTIFYSSAVSFILMRMGVNHEIIHSASFDTVL